LQSHHHFYLCNRLFLLNLASIYTTGFENPDTAQIIPELKFMIEEVGLINTSFNTSFPTQALNNDYINLYNRMVIYVNHQPDSYSHFNHFEFIKEYVNPLFKINQKLIIQHQVSSRSNLDYSLNKAASSIFDKNLYFGQNTKGIFIRVTDEKILTLINDLGKSLFYDPILSGNNQRSCASCHNSNEYFADTSHDATLQFNKKDFLTRSTPTLLNVSYNHLLMLDGKHYTLQHQGVAVITNPLEMNSNEKEVLDKVLSCKEYKMGFEKLVKYTPQEKNVTMEHVVSALSFYYGKFSKAYSPFDRAMNAENYLDKEAVKGFNLFMSKAQCATCHFVPQFNGVKPPFVGSEFEVLGTPTDLSYKHLSADLGRATVFSAPETQHAFRTGSLRNIAKTKPYMHNGVFKTLEQVIEFYNGGGGAGRGLKVENQTLSADSLKLTDAEKRQLIVFMNALTEDIPFEAIPNTVPISKNKMYNTRKVGGEY
jgi:cytochrome c peroxidase